MSSLGYIIPVDPVELASRFPSAVDPLEDDDPWASDDEDLDEIDDNLEADYQELGALFASSEYESRIQPLLDRIPDKEADFIELYFLQRKRQADIAAIFDITQAAVSYRLDRGIKRLKYLLSIPEVSEEELRTDLQQVFSAEIDCPRCKLENPCCLCGGTRRIFVDVEILVGMWQTTCQSQVATLLNLTQSQVRHRFFKAVRNLPEYAKQNETLEKYALIFETISKKRFNILREVRLPQWSGRGKDQCL